VGSCGHKRRSQNYPEYTDEEANFMYQSPDSLQKQGEVLVILFIFALILASFAPLVSAEEKANEQSD
jgi:hypothetical protein